MVRCATLLLAVCSTASAWATARAETILLDGIHAHNRIERGLAPEVYDYHDLHGPRRALQELRSRGAAIREVREGRLDAAALTGVDLLYLNLVSSDLPAFFPEEIAAVRAFVERGGGLLLITDHSNCYHHVNKLEPLVEALDLRLYRESALERHPHYLGQGPGWIVVDHLLEHPITQGLHWISFQTGSPVDDRGAVATLSDDGWGDRWETAPFGENALRRGNLGNYGNFVFDEGERRGRLAVVTTRELGEGRIVVVGDQNVFGDVWIRYGDNLRLFENVVAWLTRSKPELGDTSASRRVLLLEDRGSMAFGSDAKGGLYHAFVALGRHVDVAAHDRMLGRFDVIVVAPRQTALDPELRTELAEHVERGGTLVWLGHDGQPGAVGEVELQTLLARLPSVGRKVSTGEVVHVVGAKGRVVEWFHVERISNEALAAPTSTPDAAQRQAEEAWVRRVLGP